MSDDLTFNACSSTINSIKGGLELKEAKVLFDIAMSIQKGCIVEIGSFRGKSTTALALGSKRGGGAPVFAVDPHETFTGVLGGQFGPENRQEFFQTMIQTGCWDTVRLINLPSEIVGVGWKEPIGFLWIDGDHRYEAVKKDFEIWERHILPGGFIAFHDSVDPSLGPAVVIKEIMRSNRYRILQQVGLTTVLEKMPFSDPDPAIKISSMVNQTLERKVEAFEFGQEPLGVVKANPALVGRIRRQMATFVESYFFEELGLLEKRDIEQDIDDYYRLRVANPARDVTQGATVDGLAIWLHLLVCQLQPELMVESGVGFGRSLYTLRKAVGNALLHAFDVSYANNLFNDPSVIYHDRDWFEFDLQCTGCGFAYFDDHINNGRRIREAYNRGFQHLVFDQCAPTGMVHLYKYPGLPSAVMLTEGLLEEGDVLEWNWRGEKIRYEYRCEHTKGAMEIVEVVSPLPSLERWIGSSPGQAAYVRLKPNPLLCGSE